MDEFDTFDDWQAYSSFVEETQRSLLRDFLDENPSAFEADTPSTTIMTFAVPMGKSWLDPIISKWRKDRRAIPSETVGYMYVGTGLDPGALEANAGTFRDQAVARWIQEIERVDSDKQPYERPRTDPVAEYLQYAPKWALQIEAWLDGLAGFACAAATADRAHLKAVHDEALDGVESKKALDQILYPEVFDRYDRETFVSGEFVESYIDRLDQQYQQLHELTLFASNPTDWTLAIEDEALPDGRGHPRTWEIRPEPAIARVEGAISLPAGPVSPDDVRATVTIDRTKTVDAPLFRRFEGFFGGTVEGADDAFPAESGDEVLVSPANVVRPVDDTDALGFSPHQRAVLARARSNPKSLETESFDEVLTWIEQSPPAVRRAFVSALGRALPDLVETDRALTALVDALDDPTESVRHATIRTLAEVATDDPTAVEGSLPAVVDRLEDRDDTVQTHAGEICAHVSATDPKLLSDHLRAIVDGFDAVPREAPSEDTHSGAEWVTRTLENVHATEIDLPTDAFGPLVEMAGSGSKAALRMLATVDPDTPAFESACNGIQSRLLPLLDEHHGTRKTAAAALNRIAAVNAPLIVATDERELFLELIRGVRNQRESRYGPLTSYRIAALFGALYPMYPEYVGRSDLIDALVEGTGREIILAAHAVILGHVGYHHPDLVEDAIEPLLTTVRESKSDNNTDRAIRVLRNLGAANPALLDETVIQELREVAKSSDVSTTKDAAVQTLGVAGAPILTEEAWQTVAKGRRYTQSVSRLAAVEAVRSILSADRPFGVEHGAFSWLAAVVTRDDDPRVIALALDVLTDYWIENRSFVERECIPVDQDSIEELENGQFKVRDVGDRISFKVERREDITNRSGVDPVVWTIKSLQKTPTPPRIRVGERLDHFASARNDNWTANFEDLTPIAAKYNDSLLDEEPIATAGHDELVSILERQATGHPDRVATVVGELLCTLSADAAPLDYREMAVILTRVGLVADEVGVTITDELADDLQADSALVRLTASATIVALGGVTSEELLARAESNCRDARSSDIADIAESMFADLVDISPSLQDTFPDVMPNDD